MEGPWMNDAAALDNRYKFNGIERIQDFGLNVDMAMYRAYDPAIGRWWQADPIAKAWENPYAAMYNNPMNWSDFLGADPSKGDTTLPEVMVTAKRSVNNAPINNLQIDGDFVYFQQGKSWYMYTQAPLEEGGTRTYGYDARAGWVFVRSDYESYKARLSAAIAMVEMMEITVATTVDLFLSGGSNTATKFGLRTMPIVAKYSRALLGFGRAAKGGYSSFNAFKSAIGSAGKGYAWHHIVEQGGSNVSKFGAKSIHNVNNLIKLPQGAGSIHAKVSGFYSSKQAFTGGKTVRQWLSTQSFQQQYDFGIKILKQFGWKP